MQIQINMLYYIKIRFTATYLRYGYIYRAMQLDTVHMNHFQKQFIPSKMLYRFITISKE